MYKYYNRWKSGGIGNQIWGNILAWYNDLSGWHKWKHTPAWRAGEQDSNLDPDKNFLIFKLANNFYSP